MNDEPCLHTWTCDRCGDNYQTRYTDHMLRWTSDHFRMCSPKANQIAHGATRVVCTRSNLFQSDYDLPERPTAYTADRSHLPFAAEHIHVKWSDNGSACEVAIWGDGRKAILWRGEPLPPWVEASLDPKGTGAFDGWDEHR